METPDGSHNVLLKTSSGLVSSRLAVLDWPLTSSRSGIAVETHALRADDLHDLGIVNNDLHRPILDPVQRLQHLFGVRAGPVHKRCSWAGVRADIHKCLPLAVSLSALLPLDPAVAARHQAYTITRAQTMNNCKSYQAMPRIMTKLLGCGHEHSSLFAPQPSSGPVHACGSRAAGVEAAGVVSGGTV